MLLSTVKKFFRNAYRLLFWLQSTESLGAIAPSEPITRYLFSKSHFASTKGLVKARAFEPARGDNKTSVFRIADLEQADVWQIGQNVADERASTLYARADLNVSVVINIGLQVEPQEPPPRHANIQGWPDTKSEVMSLAQQIAAEAELHMSADN